MEEESLKVIVEPSLLAHRNSYATARSDNAASSSSTTLSFDLEAAVCTTNDIVARTFSVDEVRADVVRIDYFRVMDRLSVTDILERFGRRMVFVGNIHNWNIWELLVEELSEG